MLARTLELEDALGDAERANASRSRFVAAASHDLLQPLSAAKLFMASIGDEAMTLRRAGRWTRRRMRLMSVEGILEALLDISKLESGKAAVQVGPVRMDRLLAQLQRGIRADWRQAKGLRLVVHPCDMRWCRAIPAYLRRILQNLIGNAIRYTRKGPGSGGRAAAGRHVAAGGLGYRAGDSRGGAGQYFQGVPPPERPRLGIEGMGLGLAIVERACALLGHPLGLCSRMGRGTCFMVQVPLSETGADLPLRFRRCQTADATGAGQDRLSGGKRRRSAPGYGAVAGKMGRAVLEAASGEEALALIEEIWAFCPISCWWIINWGRA